LFTWFVAVALLGSAQLAQAAKPIGIVTILGGKASVIRGLSQFDALEGVRLQSDDLVRTDKDAFLRVEYDDETWIELGPETSVQMSHPGGTRVNRPALYLMTGWLKIGCGKADAAAKRSLASIGMDLLDLSGAIVVHALDGTLTVFAEQGSARWVDRAPHGSPSVVMNPGDFLVAGRDNPPKLQRRPAAEFIAAMPHQYRDTLPIRYSLFSSRSVLPKDQHDFAYADVEAWIDAEPTVRRQFLTTWRRKIHDVAFRASLDRTLSLHPEWDPILHPEKYETDPQTGARVLIPPGSRPTSVPPATPGSGPTKP
jgi:hypothetical protein